MNSSRAMATKRFVVRLGHMPGYNENVLTYQFLNFMGFLYRQDNA